MPDASDDIVRVPVTDPADVALVRREDPVVREFREPETIEPGDWFWVTSENWRGEEHTWFGCVYKVGSNFVEFHTSHSPHGGHSYRRVHLNDFHKVCRREPDPESVIKGKIAHYQNQTRKLLGEVQEVTARLGVGKRHELEAHKDNTNTALVRLNKQTDVGEYKQALIRAEKEQLPELFKAIKENNEELARWMSAEMMPLQAQAEGLKGLLGGVQDRIFNVELYAGLTEQVEQVRDGEPAGLTDRLHVMQRRCYMDEECIASYEAGGITCENIGQFDEWISKPEHMERILPFPRCLVAFRVRRKMKERLADLNVFVKIALEEADKTTYLYIRNGERLYRMNTALEFGHKIFPDIKEFEPRKLRAYMFITPKVDRFITEAEYQVMVAENEAAKKQAAVWKAQHPEKDHWKCPHRERHYELDRYHPFDPSSVYYDEMVKVLEDKQKQYNRIALIIQGLFDRSPVLHPHPPVHIWTPEGFEAGVKLVYDIDRALNQAEKPDFEAYRAKCNETLKLGCVTVGQDIAWQEHEAEKENKRRENDWRNKDLKADLKRYKPYGNPGPGRAARVGRFMSRAKRCGYSWMRKRVAWNRWDDTPIRTTFTAEASQVLNADAYSPGDFKQFFADPRTRADYLVWAPVLLAAEEYKAGNLKPEEPC